MSSVYTVGQINTYIKNMFNEDFLLKNVSIKGEVSNCKYHTKGHIYFTIKDDIGSMSAVMFVTNRSGLNFKLSDGMQIVVKGSITVYERDGKYQMYAKEITLDGEGDLYKRYEQLKNELEEMGMFSPVYKQAIPKFIKKLGVVTASTGAAIQDIINITKRRNPYVEIILYPALVQGEAAAESVVNGIHALESFGVDVMIVGRGGGSIEDLWAFNERIVAEAVFACKVPIISAVGHETDYTIIDFVSDLRAPTPSAAAELAVYDLRYILDMISGYKKALDIAIFDRLEDKKFKLSSIETKLKYLNPITQVKVKKQKISEYRYRLNKNIQSIFLRDKHRLAVLAQKLHGASPLTKLESGYAYIEDNDKKAIKSIDMIDVGESFNIYLKDGMLKANVLDKKRSNNVN